MLSYAFLFKRKILHELMHIKFFPSISTRVVLLFLGRLYLNFFIVITARTLILIEIGELYLMSP